MSMTGGGRGTNQYGIRGRSVQRQGSSRSSRRHDEEHLVLDSPHATFDSVPISNVVLLTENDADLSGIRPTSIECSIARYVERRAEFAYSAAHLEGNTFTLPEVYTLLDGTPPQGKSVEETNQVLALADASEVLLDRLGDETFRLDLDTSDEMNAILARHESIDPGVRRTRSAINPAGQALTVSVMGDSFRSYDRA